MNIDLDDVGPGYRSTDPETSRWAALANQVRKHSDRREVLRLYWVYRASGLNDFELAAVMKRQHNSVGKRRTDLRDKGLVEHSGDYRPSTTGKKSIVWRITPEGVELLKFLGIIDANSGA